MTNRGAFAVVFVLFCGFTTACQDSFNDGSHTGNNGTTGGTGEPGPQGPAGPAGPGIAWKDATGTRADGVLANPSGGSLLYIDDDGRIWKIDAESAALDVFAADVPVQWSNADCTGVPYVKAPLPRFTFRTLGDFSVRVRADTTQAFDVSVASTSRADGGCDVLPQAAQDSLIALPAAALLDIPALTIVAPLHPERP